MLNGEFATRLDRLKYPVKQLYYEGISLADYEGKKIVAVVGTRKPTSYSKHIIEEWVPELVREGVIIVSGLAIGVDHLAHQACLKEHGATIAVLPSGIANIYPATNRSTAKMIVERGGTLLSEYESNHQPRKIEFLERNRIIAAMSDLVFIPEAAANSGSLNTANHARTCQVPVAAVPGNITSPMSVGTNHLLSTGAHAVTSTQDIFKLLGMTPSKHNEEKVNVVGDTPEQTLILQKLGTGITNADELQEATALSTAEFQMAATMLELQGKIQADQNGNWHFK